jgi:hypothetical protein
MHFFGRAQRTANRSMEQSKMNFSSPGMSSGSKTAGYRQDALWLRIHAFTLDDPESKLPFSLRLAHENGWSRHYVGRVIEEYKKFCYLALTAGHEVSPSDAVDQAWHMHLIYTRSYWKDFCSGVLRHPFHHNPSRGGPEERDKFRALYEETLNSYGRIFGVSHPHDIWPSAEARYVERHAYCRIDTASCWVMPKPRPGFLSWRW